MSHEQLIENLVEEAEPVEAFPPKRIYRKTAFYLTLYLLMFPVLIGLRPAWGELIFRNWIYPTEMLATLILAYGGAFAAIRLSVPTTGRMIAVWMVAALSIILWVGMWHVGNISLRYLGMAMEANHFNVTLGVIFTALPVVVYLFYHIRKGAPTQLQWAGVMTLLSGTACGHFIMRTIGEASNYADVFLWCYTPVLVVAATGVFFGQKFLRW